MEENKVASLDKQREKWMWINFAVVGACAAFMVGFQQMWLIVPVIGNAVVGTMIALRVGKP